VYDPEVVTVPVVVMGAGPAGLTAGYELANRGCRCVILEKDAACGGLARTFEYKGHLFDLGGHRFYTKVALVERIWREVLGDDLLTRKRLSRIYYRGRYFHYPLEPVDVVRGLSVTEIVRCCASYAKAHLFPARPEEDLETWVCNRFGRRLFDIFFKTYTEKVWGIACKQIHADWAAQRIGRLSMLSLARSVLPARRDERGEMRTLIREFLYPRRGPGMMWSRMQSIVAGRGSAVLLNTPVDKILWKQGRVEAVLADGRRYEAGNFISSIPIRELIQKLDPPPPDWLQDAASHFHYRDFLTVGLIVRGKNPFPDNWIYVHDPAVAVGRIQNYANWSPEMSPIPGEVNLGMEYFCFQGDSLWSIDDQELIRRARKELAQLRLVEEPAVVDGMVLRVPKAYPVYDESYQRGLKAIREFLKDVPNLQLVGRNGMHRYNNQDHSMLTAIMAARNILGARYDLWDLQLDADYLERGPVITEEEIQALDLTQPLTPQGLAEHARGGRV